MGLRWTYATRKTTAINGGAVDTASNAQPAYSSNTPAASDTIAITPNTTMSLTPPGVERCWARARRAACPPLNESRRINPRSPRRSSR